MPLNLPISPLQKIPNHPGSEQGITLFIKRDDLLHPEIEGSKGRKLAAVLPLIKASYPGGLVTFGGAFSNHLHAVATAGRIFGIPTIGLLRGEFVDLNNPTLLYCQENGMTLQPMPRAKYDVLKNQAHKGVIDTFPNCYILPEGGNTPAAVSACMAIPKEIESQLPPENVDSPLYLCVPAGTGCTAAGLVAGLSRKADRQVYIFPVSSQDLDEDAIRRLLPEASRQEHRFTLIQDYAFGGFAKFHSPVLAFVKQFFTATKILPDPIYTAKMLYGVYDMLAKGVFPKHSSVVVLHTGGLQGWVGFEARYGPLGIMSH
jgi:1-aminocyclopropane-1-carboxylate deaminase/D-cysteine desulfhydrase-like pyridoxal-dependent ACC family enzyme